MATRHLPLYEFFWHLAEEQKAGIPLRKTLQNIAAHAPSARLRRIYADVALSVQTGSTLTEALRAHPRYYDGTVCAVVDASEQSGRLAQGFSRCAEIVKLRDTRKREMDRATRSPKITALTLVGLAAISGMENTAAAGALFFFFVAVCALGWRISPLFRRIVRAVLLYVPPIGTILRRDAWARFSESISFLYASGFGLRDAVRIAAETQNPSGLQPAFMRIADRMTHKSSLEAAFAEEKDTDRLVRSMIRAGERSGNLSASLHEATARLDEENDRQITALRQYTGPLMVIILGIVVYKFF